MTVVPGDITELIAQAAAEIWRREAAITRHLEAGRDLQTAAERSPGTQRR